MYDMRLPHTEEIPDELYEAARVSRFMSEGQAGRWRLVPFTITDTQYEKKMLHLHYESEHPDEMKARAVPPGDYICLRRQMIDLERHAAVEEQVGDPADIARSLGMTEEELIAQICPDEVAWIPVMSDTPAEICEHDHALNNASGRVLITGLGLGCLPHALLTKPGIVSIDIIDIDPDVIALTGPYLTDPRVTIHQGSAIDPVTAGVKAGRQFDYVWHDIWTHVSDKNLDDDTAEHGISYRRLFKLYDRLFLVGQQAAWAYPMAKTMKRKTEAVRNEEREFRRRLKAMSPDEQLHHVKLRVVRHKVEKPNMQLSDESALALFDMMDPDGSFEVHLIRKLADPDFWAGLESWSNDNRDRLGHPNAHLEATT